MKEDNNGKDLKRFVRDISGKISKLEGDNRLVDITTKFANIVASLYKNDRHNMIVGFGLLQANQLLSDLTTSGHLRDAEILVGEIESAMKELGYEIGEDLPPRKDA